MSEPESKKGKRSREKGKRREKEWTYELRSHGFQANRSQQYRGGEHSCDVVSEDCPVLRWEVKGTEILNVRKAVDKALDNTAGQLVAVAWKKNGARWIVSMDGEQFLALVRDLQMEAWQAARIGRNG